MCSIAHAGIVSWHGGGLRYANPPYRLAARSALFRRDTNLDGLARLAELTRQPGEAAQGFGHLHPAADAGDNHIDHGEGRVEMAARLKLLDRDTRLRERLGIGDA